VLTDLLGARGDHLAGAGPPGSSWMRYAGAVAAKMAAMRVSWRNCRMSIVVFVA
jgi:hypothetical protein